MILRYITIIIVFVVQIPFTFGQGIHFTQFYNNPLLLNPAMTGYTNNCIKGGLISRKQWVQFQNYYNTYSGFIEIKLPPNKKQPRWIKKQDWFGIGLTAYSDNAGDGNLKTKQVFFTTAYHKGRIKLFQKKLLDVSIGLGYGIFNKSVDYNKLYFNNQWNGYNFDNSINNLENHVGITYTDISKVIALGTNLNLSPDNSNYRAFVGLSYLHYSIPRESFYEDHARLTNKITIHGGYYGPLFSILAIESELMYASINKANDIILGSNYFLYKNPHFFIGTWCRLNNELIFSTGLNLDERRIKRMTISYDYNYQLHNRSIEFSLIFKTDYNYCVCDDDGPPHGPILSGRGYEDPRHYIPGEEIANLCDEYVKSGFKALKNAKYLIEGYYLSFLHDSGIDGEPAVLGRNRNALGGNLILSGKIGRYFYLGGGIGYENWNAISFFPELFLDARYGLIKDRNENSGLAQVYIFVDGGVSIRNKFPEEFSNEDKVNPFFVLGSAFKFSFTRRDNPKVIFSVGYKLQPQNEIPFKTLSSTKYQDIVSHFIILKTGIMIGN
jgi:type IX secretion system PorP/SprF family membrane protein